MAVDQDGERSSRAFAQMGRILVDMTASVRNAINRLEEAGQLRSAGRFRCVCVFVCVRVWCGYLLLRASPPPNDKILTRARTFRPGSSGIREADRQFPSMFE